MPGSDRLWHNLDLWRCPTLVRKSLDCVVKLFCPFERARLIQDLASMRNVDSRNHSFRFDCCVFIFYSFSAVTFATQSARTGHLNLVIASSAMSRVCARPERYGEPSRFDTMPPGQPGGEPSGP